MATLLLYQPPLLTEIHSLQVPVLTGSIHDAITFAAPQTSSNSDSNKLPAETIDGASFINIVLVLGHKTKRSVIESDARRRGMRPTSVRDVLSLAAAKPRLYEDLIPQKHNNLPLIAVVATQRVVVDGIKRVPVLWWWGDYRNRHAAPSRSLGLFQDQNEEYWDHYYWFAFVAN